MFDEAVTAGRLLSQNARPQNVLYPGLLAASVAYIGHASVLRAATCYLLLLTMYSIAASLNNYADLTTDALNKRSDNPLVNEVLPQNYLLPFGGICLLVILLLQPFLYQPYSFVLSVLYLGLLYAYSSKPFDLKSRGLYGTSLLACCYGALPLLLGLAQANHPSLGATIAVASFIQLALMPTLLAKDYKDVVGDTVTGKRTPLIIYGQARLHTIALSFTLLVSGYFLGLAIYTHTNLYLAAVFTLVYGFMTMRLHSKNPPSNLASICLRLVLLLMPLSLLQ